MTITFISCYLSIHQVPLCNAFFEKLGNNFNYIAVNEMPKWRVDTGYSDLNSLYPYVVKAYEKPKMAQDLANNSDVVIIGSAPDKYITKRLKQNKLTFRCSERFYKEGVNNYCWARDYIAAWIHHGRFQKQPLYMLCASAYTKNDCQRFNNYTGKMFKWGYFPETIVYDVDYLLDSKRTKEIQLLWVGRLIDWKHPEMAVETAKFLKDKSIPFSLTVIGDGELYEKLIELVNCNNLIDQVHFRGSLPSNEVRKYMETANIYLMTSDYNEGWGAVVNEAMNSGCAVVASEAAGSVPYLIQNGINGICFENRNQESLNNIVYHLCMDNYYCEQLGRNAYDTIISLWNAKIAANRFLDLIYNIDRNYPIVLEGPCSTG